jgi:hypothetical protein
MDISHVLKRAVVVCLHLLLLVPVPAFATYTLGTWIPGAGQDNWNPVGSGLNLALSPTENAVINGTRTLTFVAPITVTGTASNVSANTSNFNSLFVTSSGGTSSGLAVTIGFSPDSNPADLNRVIYQTASNNQFNQGALPSSLYPANTGASFTVVTGDYAVVTFVFTANSPLAVTAWAPVSSTPVNIAFTAGN